MKHIINKLLRRTLGIEISRFPSKSAYTAQLIAGMRSRKVDFIFDVGANDGGFGRAIRFGGYSGRILSFEPLSSAHAKLVISCQNDDN